MAATVTLQKSWSARGKDSQRVEFAVDCGAYRFVSARLRIDAVRGSPTTGAASFALQHAAVNEEVEYLTHSELTFTNIGTSISTSPNIEIKTTEKFARFLRWIITDWTYSGGADVTLLFSIELTLKD